MRWLAICVVLLACQRDNGEPAARVREHTSGARADAFRVLSMGLDVAYLALRDHPDDHAAALANARLAITAFYKDDANRFELYAGEGVWMLYLPARPQPQIWLARDAKRVLTELDQLPPVARKIVSPVPSK